MIWGFSSPSHKLDTCIATFTDLLWSSEWQSGRCFELLLQRTAFYREFIGNICRESARSRSHTLIGSLCCMRGISMLPERRELKDSLRVCLGSASRSVADLYLTRLSPGSSSSSTPRYPCFEEDLETGLGVDVPVLGPLASRIEKIASALDLDLVAAEFTEEVALSSLAFPDLVAPAVLLGTSISLSERLFGGGRAGRSDSVVIAAKSAVPTPAEEEASCTIRLCGGSTYVDRSVKCRGNVQISIDGLEIIFAWMLAVSFGVGEGASLSLSVACLASSALIGVRGARHFAPSLAAWLSQAQLLFALSPRLECIYPSWAIQSAQQACAVRSVATQDSSVEITKRLAQIHGRTHVSVHFILVFFFGVTLEQRQISLEVEVGNILIVFRDAHFCSRDGVVDKCFCFTTIRAGVLHLDDSPQLIFRVTRFLARHLQDGLVGRKFRGSW
ncbi:hypothetical protein KCU65_g25, partial [Aureobasidium melanogenum]